MDCSFLSLEGKIALVTGGSRGIGKAIAVTFADAGADVAIASRKLPDLEKVSAEIKGLGRKALCVPTHTRKVEDMKNLVQRVLEEFGRIDVLVNNAATNPAMGPIVDTDESVYDQIMETNLKGYFMMSKLVGKIMREQKSGNIINVSSGGNRSDARVLNKPEDYHNFEPKAVGIMTIWGKQSELLCWVPFDAFQMLCSMLNAGKMKYLVLSGQTLYHGSADIRSMRFQEHFDSEDIG